MLPVKWIYAKHKLNLMIAIFENYQFSHIWNFASEAKMALMKIVFLAVLVTCKVIKTNSFNENLSK